MINSQTEITIRLNQISKKFHIGKQQSGYRTLRDTIADSMVAPFRRAARLIRGHASGASELNETIWALKDVSMEISKGEVVGLIGRNGAGKSTLLKILSRITEPTQGSGEIHGRVGSLLEVGTGFHPELTGRENVYLNGTILGMKRTEITNKFDEIVSFAEIEKFIDTPVKHYSSGMYLRLAFAVAAHLETEIVFVDEVLAVGDARFQKRCISKMEDIGKEGRTVLFVSHNMPAVTRLCKRTILLEEGRVIQDGPTKQVVSGYLRSQYGLTGVREWDDPSTTPGNDIVRMHAIRVITEDGGATDAIDIRKQVGLEIDFEVLREGYSLIPNFGVVNEEGQIVFVTIDQDAEWRNIPRPKGRFISTVWIPGNLMAEGTFFVGGGIATESPFTVHCDQPYAVAFQVIDTLEGNSARGEYTRNLPGIIRPLLPWSTKFSPNGK
jgi:lipopolysaccharide transport system ATP-binding protein